MSDRDEFGRREPDDDERRDAYEARRRRSRSGCLCGYPDWPGQCPGPENCPVHGQDHTNSEEDKTP